jgi:two-component system KDP operon response regulator KdpE
MTHILVVDDEPQILRTLALNLRARHYEVSEAVDGTSALDRVAAGGLDLVVLDLGLPDMDGLDIIRAVRSADSVPIIVLTARVDTHVTVAALDLGADDYVTKPFDMNELLARVRTAVRRSTADTVTGGLVQVGQAQVDLAARTVTGADGAPIHLTPNEWHLLSILVSNPGRLVTGPQLLTRLRGGPDNTDASYLRGYMAQLRRKLEPEPARPRHLITEPGMGYRFQP